MSKDIISVLIAAPPERVYEIIIEKIKVWEPSHNLPFVVHKWIPCEGGENREYLKIKSPLWTFIAKCIELRGNEVKWEFIEGPLKGRIHYRQV